MTLQELEAIKQAYDSSTPGHWKYGRDLDTFNVQVDNIVVEEICHIGPKGLRLLELDETTFYKRHANAEFICRAHDAIPKLLAEIERLNKLKSHIEIGE